jgi:hypothetical protein
MTIKITSPIKDFTGNTSVGSTPLVFENGTAVVEKLSDAVKAYLLGAGYTVDGESVTPPASYNGQRVADEAPVDSRDLVDPTQVGSQLRDAAVDPAKADFLPPTGAGTADPHGPKVVSPEVHASQGVRPVTGGPVAVDNPDAQEAKETAATAAAVKPLDDLTIPQLQKVAESRGVDLKGVTLKADIIDVLKLNEKDAAEKAEAEQRTYVITYTDAAGDEQKLDVVGDDQVEGVQARFADGGDLAGCKVTSVEVKQADATSTDAQA